MRDDTGYYIENLLVDVGKNLKSHARLLSLFLMVMEEYLYWQATPVSIATEVQPCLFGHGLAESYSCRRFGSFHSVGKDLSGCVYATCRFLVSSGFVDVTCRFLVFSGFVDVTCRFLVFCGFVDVTSKHVHTDEGLDILLANLGTDSHCSDEL